MPLQHGGGRRRAGGHHRDRATVEIAALLVRRVKQKIDHDRCTAQMRHLLLRDGRENGAGLGPAQTNMRARKRRDRPRKAPAVAMEHRQGPEIDRMPRHAPHHEIADRVEIGAAVMQHDAFRIAGRARGVVERDGVPFVFGIGPGEIGIARGKEALVIDLAERLARRAERVADINHQQLPAELLQRRADNAREFAVGDQRFRLAVFENEGDGLRHRVVC